MISRPIKNKQIEDGKSNEMSYFYNDEMGMNL
jgi:hypothetical protein